MRSASVAARQLASRSARVSAWALAAVTAIGAANGQTLPWPSNPSPQGPAQGPWPASAPSAQPMAPAGPMGGGPPMPPTAEQQDCLRQFTELRSEVEKRGIAAKGAGEKHAPREEMCKLVTAYSSAETKWVKYSSDNMAKCGIPKQVVEQIKAVHVRTANAQKQICAAGPGRAGPSTPSLSDALGTATLPNRETEQRKAGGTLDTLTGNALAR